MGFVQEFKDFAMKGNVVDMAVGIVIGGAFGKIVSSFVGDVVMPAVGMITGGIDLSKYAITLKAAEEGNDAVQMGVGTFANTIIDFVIVALAIFMVVKAMNNMKKKDEAAPAAPAPPPKQEVLLGEIRDLLAKKG